MSRLSSHFRPGLWLWFLWNLAALMLLVSTAFTLYPGLHHDSVLYATPIVNMAARGVWEIDSYIPSMISDSGKHFTRHGQLYQFLFGRVFHCASYERLLAATAVFNAVTFLATLLLSRRMIATQSPRMSLLLSSGIAAMTALFLLWVQGRPEHLIPLLMLAPFAAHEWPRTARYARHVGYAALGLVVVTSPLTGVLCCLGVVGWIALRYKERFFAEMFACAGVSLATAFATLLITCPVPPWQWVKNTTQASQGTPSNLGAFFTHLTNDIPYWNLIILSSILLLAIALVRRRMIWVALLLGAVFVSLLWKFQVYVLAGFVPVIMLAMVARHGREALGLPRLISQVPTLIVTLVSVTSLATFARMALLATVFAREGVSFAKTSAEIQGLRYCLGPNERLGFFWLARPSFVAFGGPGQGLLSVDSDVILQKPDLFLPDYETQHGCKVRYLLLPQHGYLIPVPPPPPLLAGGAFKLVRNGWTTQPAKLAGMTISDSIPGYQYALYERVD